MTSSFSSSSQPPVVGLLRGCKGWAPCPHLPPCSRQATRPRTRRVLYPARVRKTMPKEATDPACRWLFFLYTLLLLQIYTEDDLWEPQSTLEQQAQDGLTSLGDGASDQPLGAPEPGTSPCWEPKFCWRLAECSA